MSLTFPLVSLSLSLSLSRRLSLSVALAADVYEYLSVASCFPLYTVSAPSSPIINVPLNLPPVFANRHYVSLPSSSQLPPFTAHASDVLCCSYEKMFCSPKKIFYRTHLQNQQQRRYMEDEMS